jgi:hypothetical protein
LRKYQRDTNICHGEPFPRRSSFEPEAMFDVVKVLSKQGAFP